MEKTNSMSTQATSIVKTDFLIVGSGLAALAFALKLSRLIEQSEKITLITKDKSISANTIHAQGGIAAAVGDDDSTASHVTDTLRAGAGLCDESVVKNYIEQAPDRIQDLINWGVRFDHQPHNDKFDLTREGAHSQRRVLHFEDHTGAEIHRAVLKKCIETTNIEILEERFAIDLIVNKQADPQDMLPTKCIGAYVLNRQSGQVDAMIAKSIFLATGGAGKVYQYTTNWSGASGDGIAMAYRAGARIADLEFMQFHPTCLYHPDARNFLISEALRGEGAELVNSHGEGFMKKYHELGSLAPRDIVARSIDAEMKKSGDVCVYLDIRNHERTYLETRFPVIFKKCLEFGIDISKDLIPVVPAAHYLCGGILTNINGQTDIENLWALGETACTGLHGANRLASNSLLECLTMAHNCSEEIKNNLSKLSFYSKLPAPWKHPQESDADEMIVIHHMWDEIRLLMWNYVGIVRSNKRLARAQTRLINILSEVKEYYSHFKIHADIIELRNIATVAHLTVACAQKRTESRGIHYNIDSAWAEGAEENQQEIPKHTIVLRGLT